MSFPFPFRSRRRAGTPAAGGNAHTLEAHIGSPFAHPQYQKKGDAVKGIDLNEHEASQNAHSRHYIRRGEYATTLVHYEHNYDPSLYTGDDGSYQSVYEAVVTTHLLHDIIWDNPSTYIQGFFAFTNVVVGTDAQGNPVHTSAPIDVPSYALYTDLKSAVENMLQPSEDDNPLFDLFATKHHVHTDYALKNHVHNNWADLMLPDGAMPARDDHNHDGVYWRHDEDISAELDLHPFINTGIYPMTTLYHTTEPHPDTFIPVNTRNVQGNSTYVFDDSVLNELIAGGFPTDIQTAIQAHATGTTTKYVLSTDDAISRTSADCVNYLGILSVLRCETGDVDQVIDNISSILNPSNANVRIHEVATQILRVNTAIPSLLRDGDPSEAVRSYKAGTYQIFWRTGYSMENAWLIDSFLKLSTGETPGEFLGHKYGDDIVSELANIVNSALETDLNTRQVDPDSLVLPNNFTIGLYLVDKTANVRIPRNVWFSGTTANIVTHNASYTPRAVVQHDVSAWMLDGGLVNDTTGVLPTNTNALAKYEMLCVGTQNNKLLPHQMYFLRQQVWSQVNLFDETSSLVPDASEAFYQLNSSTLEHELIHPEIGVSSHKATDWAAEGDAFLDDASYWRHEYRKVVIAGDVFSATDQYFKQSANVDDYGNPVFIRLTNGVDYNVGQRIDSLAFDVFRRICIFSENTYCWSKKPVRRASTPEGVTDPDADSVINNADYYKYVFDPGLGHNAFVYLGKGVSLPSRPDGKVPQSIGDYTGPVYTNYEIYTSRLDGVKVLPSGTKTVTITKACPFLNGVTYVNFRNNDVRLAREVVVVPAGDPLPPDTNDVKYVRYGTICEVGSGKDLYGIVLPTYDDTIGTSENPVYCAAYFFKTQDTAPVSGKRYFTAEKQFFNRFTGTAFVAGLAYYECLDLERFFDIWCAINQLTTVGSDVVSSAGGRIKYSVGEDGHLITWDDWQRFISNNDANYKMAHNHVNKLLIDKFSSPDGTTLYFDGRLITTSSSAHEHGNKSVLDALVAANEITPTFDVITRLHFGKYSVAYIEDIAEIKTLVEDARPGLETVKHFSFSSTNEVLVDGVALLYKKDYYRFPNETTLAKITELDYEHLHWHGNKPDVLDELGVSPTGGLMFHGNEIAALAATYEVSIAEDVSITELLAKGLWQKTVAEINEILGKTKTIFASILELERCQFQFKLVAQNGETILAEKDPIAVFEDSDDSHLSAGFVSSANAIRVFLPSVDYYASFSGSKGSVKEWASDTTKFSLVLSIIRPGTLGTGDGQYFENYETLRRLLIDDDGDLCVETNKLLYVANLGNAVANFGFTKRSDFNGCLAFVSQPGNWASLVSLEFLNGRMVYDHKNLAFVSDIPVFENEDLLKAFELNEDGRLQIKQYDEEGKETDPIVTALLSDVTSLNTTLRAWVNGTFMPSNPTHIELFPESTSASNGGYIDFHFNKSSNDYTSRIIENASGRIGILANLSVTGTLAVSGNTTIGNITIGSATVPKTLTLNGKEIKADAIPIKKTSITYASTPTETDAESGVQCWRLDALGTDNDTSKFLYKISIANPTASTGNLGQSCVVANIAQSSDHNPIYVPADSLIFINRSKKVCVRVPLEWLSMVGLKTVSQLIVWKIPLNVQT